MAFFATWQEPVAGEAPRVYKGLDAVQRMASLRIPHEQCKPTLDEIRPLWTFQWLLSEEQRVMVENFRLKLYEAEAVVPRSDVLAVPEKPQKRQKKKKQQAQDDERKERERSLFD